MINAIILAGGKGNRMEDSLPKPLVRVKGKPILAYQLDYLLGSGVIDNVILSLGHRAGEVIDFINYKYKSAPIQSIIEDEPLGTGGAIKKGLTSANSEFAVVFNCDDITDIDLKKLSKLRESYICVAHPRLPFGRVRDEDGYAVFEEKPVLNDWVSTGWYLFNRDELLKYLPDKGSVEYDVFPKIKIKLFKHVGFWRSLNTKKDIIEAEKEDFPDILIDNNYTEDDDMVIPHLDI